ncbi:ABC transporter substrate-binding protein [Treponema putidum]|uniref:ABC transporter substrate-binding protein n=1 Tax=Treponema putidum TaxID=221027 RepID=UPI003D904079
MKKIIFSALFLLIASTFVFAAGSSEKESKDLSGKTLNVVATSAYKELFDAFTAKTNVKVEFLSMSSGEVLARTRAEGKPIYDVWFGGGIDAFMSAKEEGFLENYVSPNSKDIPVQYKDSDGAWIAKGITVVGFIGNKDVLAEKKLPMPKTWAELADPKYKGEVIMSDPAISGTNYGAVKGLLDLFGEEKGWAYWEKINANIPFLGKRGKDPQEKTAQGEFAVGIIPADEKAFKLADDKNLIVVYPEDGIPWVPEGTAIFKSCPNLDAAKAFIDFMLTKEGQEIIARHDGKDAAQLVKPGVKGLSLGLPKDKLIKEDLSTFGKDRQRILDKFASLRPKM